ncbi:BNR-4 repeat-containing protein [Ereboglobus luteus]|uniref:BNR-4 repeat-containing protein n=1 Tax=Ereboglobus luteus TaxID=1796921 RepID=UPI001F2C1E06|nr:BNR-4 repeat-containing protein [Ereboglobus luteus]
MPRPHPRTLALALALLAIALPGSRAAESTSPKTANAIAAPGASPVAERVTFTHSFKKNAPTAFPEGGIRKSVRADGYRGIWFTLGFKFEYGDKYSGGLGTYTANHQPLAVYAPAVKKTFFTWGGTPASDQRLLVIMVSYYDHEKGTVPRPVALYADPSVKDPHDNASIQIDADGHIWVLKSGRGRRRPGIIFRSTRPYDIGEFECVARQEFTYPEIWHGPDDSGGFFLLFTKYFKGTKNGPARNLFWKTSADGRAWSEDHALAAFGGHYQTSGRWTGAGADGKRVTKYATFFNYHPESHVDRRTNIYYAQTTDAGKTWTTAAGAPLALPLTSPDNPALLVDLKSQGKFMYTCDLNFDASGNPILLCIVSRAGEPGPKGDPREWFLMHWKNGKWETRTITTSDHNYDMGSIYVNGNNWKIIAPTETGPQRYGTGGEVAVWTSNDNGVSWKRERRVTNSSEFNHGYVRRPEPAADPFYAFWADGNPSHLSESRLYFTNSDGTKTWRLPYEMPGDEARPELLPAASEDSR